MSLLKYAIVFSVMVLTVVATIYPGKTGYYARDLYYSDSKCKTTPVAGVFIPLGVCTNNTDSYSKSSQMFTTDPSNKNQVYQTIWYGSGSCNSAASFVASSLSDTTNAVSIDTTCVLNANANDYNPPYYQRSIGYVAALPTIAFPQYLGSYYDAGGCTKGVVTSITMETMNQKSDGSYECFSNSCTSIPFRSTATCPMPTGTLATGYAQTSYFNKVPCTAAYNQGSSFTKLGVCDPITFKPFPGRSNRWNSQMMTAYTSGATTVFVLSEYETANCGGRVYYNTYYPAGYCPTTWTSSNSFGQYSLVSTLPAAPAVGFTSFDYATPAACAATDPTQIVKASYSSNSNFLPANNTQITKCYNPRGSGPTQTRTLCGPQTFTSTTGGFIVTKYYADSTCITTPTRVNFYQSNICAVNNATTSYKFTTATSANGITVASQAMYRNTACTGTPLMTSPNVANTTQICKGSSSNNNGVIDQWSTTTFTSVMGINGGFLVGYSTPSTCAAQTQASMIQGVQYLSNTCGNTAGRNNSLTVLNACGVPAATVAQVISVTQTVSSASLTLATVQSSAFQTTFKQAVAMTADVAVSAVQVNSHRIPVLSPIKRNQCIIGGAM